MINSCSDRPSLPTLKLLFLDTNALVKRFVFERGHDILMWLLGSPEIVLAYNVHIVTSIHVCNEFPNTIAKMVAHCQISEAEAKGILARSKGYINAGHAGLHIVDTGPLPGFHGGRDTSPEELFIKHALKERDRTDCAIMASIVNYLRYATGGSLPHVVTSDKGFIKVVKKEGFTTINPEKITIADLKGYLKSL